MSRFSDFLQQTGERLSLPKATRSLILVEVAADLDDLFEHYLSQGLSEEEAAARAEEKVDMSDEALAELVRIHSDMRSWTDRITGRVQPFWERMAMASIVLYLVAGAAITLDAQLFSRTSVFVWPVLAIFVALMVSSVVQMVRFSTHPDPRRLRADLATPLFLGGASLVIGFGGFAIDLYLALRLMADHAGDAAPISSRAIMGGVSTLMIALLVALCAAVVWFVFAERVARLEQRTTSSLLEV
jgi:hypothetical protein